jgi:hypothetical protein
MAHGAGVGTWKDAAIVVGIGGNPDGNLAEVAQAGHAPASFTGSRQRRQEQRRKDGDDGNDNQ